MSDESTFQTIEAEGIDRGDPAKEEPYDEDASDLEPEPDDDEVLPRQDGEGTAAPEDVERLTREQSAQVEEF